MRAGQTTFSFLLDKGNISLYIWFAFFFRVLPETIVKTECSPRLKESIYSSGILHPSGRAPYEDLRNSLMRSHQAFKNTACSLWFARGFSASHIGLRPSVPLEISPLHCLSESNPFIQVSNIIILLLCASPSVVSRTVTTTMKLSLQTS